MNDYKTVERLQCELSASDTILIYDSYVLIAYRVFEGYKAEIYMFTENPGNIESKLDLMANPNVVYTDGGHAIEWALQFIKDLS